MERKNIHPQTLFRRAVAGHTLYSPVVVVKGGTFVFVSGLLARDSEGRIVGKGDMGAQIRQVGENLRLALESAGATLDDLVPTCTYVTDIDEFFRHVEVKRLSHPDFLVEIEAFAVIDER